MRPVELLQQLLRIDTTNPPGNEGPAAECLRAFLDDAGARTEIHKSPAGRPNLVARIGPVNDRAPLVLVSHTDVVPVERERWTRDPFGGEIDQGFVWGRGALDMKGIAVMHACALAALASGSQEPTREVIVLSVADEEAGGSEGARWVLDEVPESVGLRPGAPPPEVLGEGAYGLSGILDRPLMPVVVGEKSALWLRLTATGQPGHGALPPADQAAVNLARGLNRIAGYGPPRVHPVMKAQFRILAENSARPRSAVFAALASGVGGAVARAVNRGLRSQPAIAALLSDTLTPTQIEAGYKHNVVPGEARASLDCRLLPDTDADGLVRALGRKLARLGIGVEEVARHGGPVSPRSPLFGTIAEVSGSSPAAPVVVPSLTAGMTDLRFFRARGATAYGWVPLVLDAGLLATIHGHDERIPIKGFEDAVVAMTEVVARAAT